MLDVMQLYREASARGASPEGQLTPEFQVELERCFGGVAREDCDFYHTMDFGPGDLVPGVWDLRGRERSYLGFVDVAGARVLEIGPASGYLTRHMELAGADVVSFELAPGAPADVIPQAGHDLEVQERLSVRYAERVRNSWWYAHTRYASRSKALYGNVYALPPDVGRFDVTLLASVLLHLQNPFRALEQTAGRTDRAVVVTEPIHRVAPEDGRAILEFAPVDTTKTVVVWWQLAPAAVIRMLRVLGFLEFSLHYHTQVHHPHHEMQKPAEETLYYTVVAERHAGWAPRLPRTPEEERIERDLRRRFAPPPAAAELQRELLGLRSSLSWRLSRPVRMAGSLLRSLGLRR
jgi:Methyltransferase domain